MRLQHLDLSLFHPGQRLCCALSGGADSIALLLALLEANREKEALGAVLSALHVHHGLRGPEADRDAAFVHALCQQHGIPLSTVRVDTPARQATHGEGMEEAARQLRYAAFRDHLALGQADALLTAHTLDDQAETVLMKLLRGAWTEGLGGISPVLPAAGSGGADAAAGHQPPSSGVRGSGVPSAGRGSSTAVMLGTILRPMLSVPRTEVERFLNERHQPWCHDSSNDDLGPTRNRLRQQVLPLLRSFNPNLNEALARTAAIARDEEAYWQGELDRILPSLLLPGKPVRGGGRSVSTSGTDRSVAVEIERLRMLLPALQRRVLRAAAATLGCRPGADDTARLLALAGLGPGRPAPSVRSGALLELGGGLRAERSLRELRLSRALSAAPAAENVGAQSR